MSTTDTRAAFEAWAQSPEGGRWEFESFARFEEGPQAGRYTNSRLEGEWQAWQAATEATKATGTAGELPSIENFVTYGFSGSELSFTFRPVQGGPYVTTRDAIEYGQQCAEAARQPAPVVTDAEADFLLLVLQNSCMKVRDMLPADGQWKRLEEMGLVKCTGSWAWEPTEKLIGILHAALAATAAPVEQPHYRMSEKPTAWLHTLPEGKFFNSDVSENSQILRDKDEADSECYFHGGTLTPLFTAEWTQAGLDYVNEKADELHKKIVGSQP